MALVPTPANPVPEDVAAGTFKTPDGVSLRFARWAPPPGRKGNACLFPGGSAFIEKCFGYLRGLPDRALRHPRKGYVRNFAQSQIDLETFINEIVLPDCPPPLFALGQSMGATILLRAAHAGLRWFDRMVLLAPMIALPGPRRSSFNRIIVRTMRSFGLGSLYVPGGSATAIMQRPFKDNLLTSDPVRYARNVAVLEAEPELVVGSPTVAWCDAALDRE